jgi:uncharacterized membrane protein
MATAQFCSIAFPSPLFRVDFLSTVNPQMSKTHAVGWPFPDLQHCPVRIKLNYPDIMKTFSFQGVSCCSVSVLFVLSPELLKRSREIKPNCAIGFTQVAYQNTVSMPYLKKQIIDYLNTHKSMNEMVAVKLC